MDLRAAILDAVGIELTYKADDLRWNLSVIAVPRKGDRIAVDEDRYEVDEVLWWGPAKVTVYLKKVSN